jgi:hypothetical protein
VPTARTLGTRMAELDRTEAERLLRAYRPRTPLAPGRVVDPAERIVRARTAFEVRKIRHSSGDPTYDRWIDHHEFTLDDGTVYSWEWHGAVYVPRGTVILCTDPASGRQVGCAIPREHVPDEVLWARPDSVQLERGTFAAGRAPLVDAAVLVVADPTEGTGLTAQEARFVLRQRAGGAAPAPGRAARAHPGPVLVGDASAPRGARRRRAGRTVRCARRAGQPVRAVLPRPRLTAVSVAAARAQWLQWRHPGPAAGRRPRVDDLD